MNASSSTCYTSTPWQLMQARRQTVLRLEGKPYFKQRVMLGVAAIWAQERQAGDGQARAHGSAVRATEQGPQCSGAHSFQ
jgi:hypothetical protein